MTDTVNGHLTKNVTTFYTNAEGILTLPEKLPLGKYRIVEISGPNGFYNEWLDTAGYENGILADDADGSFYVDFTITTDRIYQATGDKNENGMDTLVIGERYSNHETLGKLTIRKAGEVLTGWQSEPNGIDPWMTGEAEKGNFTYETRPLAGAEYTITAAEDIYTQDRQLDNYGNRTLWYAKGDVVAVVTTGDGTADTAVFAPARTAATYDFLSVIYDGTIGEVSVTLPLGSYHIAETKPPYGYAGTDAAFDVTLAWDNQTQEIVAADAVEFHNEREKAKVGIYKNDLESGKYLAGAVFNLYTADDIYDADGRRCAIAYTKIIPVRHHLQRCLDYTSNPNKTEIFTESDLKRLLSYTQNQDKTEHQLYVSGFQCDPDTACQSMEETKRVWFMPTDKGILAYHIIQSFAPGEATPEQVHQIGCEFARRFLADRFECTVSTHLDKGHLHNHIVTNSVSFIDGKMFRNDFATYYQGIRKISDELCRENKLSVIETDGKGEGYADWLSGKTGKPTIRSMVRKDVELAMAAADTFDGFVAELQAMGYMVKYGPRVEHMAVRHQSAQRSVRIDRLDARYSESALRDYYRQLRHLPADMCREYKAQHAPEPAQWLSPELAPVGKRMRYRSSLSKPHRKVSGFMACYYRYCALLRKAYHGKATKRCYFLLREDFKRFNRYQQQTHLLWEHRLQTLAEVQAHKSNLENQIEQLARQRKVLYRQKQEPERAAREEQIQKLTKQIKALRHEFYICTDIEADAAMVQEKLRQAELAAQQERNEVKEDEYKRRSSRPDGARGASVFRGGY